MVHVASCTLCLFCDVTQKLCMNDMEKANDEVGELDEDL